MKRSRLSIAALLLACLPILTGCPKEEPVVDKVTPVISSVSITDGSTIGISTGSLTIIWSVPVTVSTASGITLNGSTVSATVQNKSMEIALGTLSYSTSYTFKIAVGAVTNKNDGAPAAAYSLSFTTEKEIPVNPTIPSTLTFNIDGSPVNSNAILPTKELYEYFRTNFGKNTLAGSMSGVAYNEGLNGVKMNDFIFGKTGKYPGLTCYDFIFYTHRGDKYASSYTWVDYNALVKNAKQWWADGGIVALMWHWHDPSRTVDNFYTGKTAENKVAFDLSAALADTTSQNYKNIISDIDTVSRYIGELQAAGIPVIFRPLHEAEGSYRWGAWFWWGNGKTDRAAACKKLYRLIYDRMTNHNKLNNILWCWTVSVDTQNGNDALYDYLWWQDVNAWYPGDDVVDFLGLDIYDDSGTKHGSHPNLFKIAAMLGGYKKMVTLAETGFIPSATDMKANGDIWSWYMPWYGTHTTSSDYNADYWKTSFSQEGIITRDKVSLPK
jgi:mannan endo-1,4-beta-mannosidase